MTREPNFGALIQGTVSMANIEKTSSTSPLRRKDTEAIPATIFTGQSTF